MRGTWVLTTLLVSCYAFAHSWPQHNQPEWFTGSQHVSKEQQHNSSQSLFVNAVPSKKLQSATDQGKNGAEDKKHNWLDNPSTWNAAVALFTLCLVGVGVGQIVVYWKQKGVMERSLMAARRSMMLTRQSIRLARHEFNIVHRPKLIARSFFPICNVVGMPNRFHFSIYNAGDQEGIIKFEECTFYATIEHDGNWTNLLAVLDEPEGHSSLIRVGAEQRHKVLLDNGSVLNKFRPSGRSGLWAPEGTDVSLQFSGKIVFLDKAGEIRHCRFDRRYDFQAGRFIRIEGSEFESRE